MKKQNFKRPEIKLTVKKIRQITGKSIRELAIELNCSRQAIYDACSDNVTIKNRTYQLLLKLMEN